MVQILLLSLRQMGKRRLVLIALLSMLPVALAAAVASFTSSEESVSEDFVTILVNGMMISGIAPIVTMALATAAFGDEVDDRTLNYLTLKPVPRYQIVVPKFLASVIVASPILIISSMLAVAIGLGGGLQPLLAVALSLFAGVVAYASVFTWAGLISSRALAFGLVYVFLWEGLVSTFLEGIRYVSIRNYTLAIMYRLDETTFQALGGSVIEFPAAIVGAVAVSLVFLLLAVFRLRTMDVP